MKNRYHVGWVQSKPFDPPPAGRIAMHYSLANGRMGAVVDADTLSQARRIIHGAFGMVNRWLFFVNKPKGWRPDEYQAKPAKTAAA